MKESWVFLIGEEGEKLIKKVQEDGLHTHKGFISAEEIREKKTGDLVKTNTGYVFLLAKPSMEDFILHGIKRRTQIVYPKDAGLIIMKLSPFPGAVVVEGGTGSGAMASVFAWFVGDKGKVYSFEKRREFIELARENLESLGLLGRVELIEKDLSEDLGVEDADMAFVDVKEPWSVIGSVLKTLKPSAPFAALVPTFNQVRDLLTSLKSLNVFDISVVEVMERHYKVNPERLRPQDRMVAHTGFLVFGRKGA